MSKDTGGNAFPEDGVSRGMTLRDYFAAKVIGGLWADPQVSGNYELLAQIAYKQADAMIEARQK